MVFSNCFEKINLIKMKAKYACPDRGFLKTLLLYTLNLYRLQGLGSGLVMGSRSGSRFLTEVRVGFQDSSRDWVLGPGPGSGSGFAMEVYVGFETEVGIGIKIRFQNKGWVRVLGLGSDFKTGI